MDQLYQGDFIRPPAEADSIILQASVGCPYRTCAFCGAYRDVAYQVRTAEEFRHHAAWLAQREGRSGRRVFLGDGDLFALPAGHILEFMALSREQFPEATRFSMYAGGNGLARTTDAEFQRLKAGGLNTVYLGLESGCEEILSAMGKPCSAETMIQATLRAQQAGIRVSVMALLGLGGRQRSSLHARATATALNRMQPRILSLLTLMLVPGTPLHEQAHHGNFHPLSPDEVLLELRELLSGLHLERTVFSANHASSFLPLQGALPRDREAMLNEVDAALRGERRLVPEFLRGL